VAVILTWMHEAPDDKILGKFSELRIALIIWILISLSLFSHSFYSVYGRVEDAGANASDSEYWVRILLWGSHIIAEGQGFGYD
jgi:hypothetical protein